MSDTPKQIGGALMVAGAVYLGYNLLVKPASDKAAKDAVQDSAGTDPATQQAQALRSALDPKFWVFNSTNVERVKAIARQITDYNDVSKKYGLITGRSLGDDLNTTLKAKDYGAFQSIVNANPTGKSVVAPVSGGIVFAKVAVNIRKSGEVIGTASSGSLKRRVLDGLLQQLTLGLKSLSLKNNILFTAGAGDFLGYWTGNRNVDDSGHTFVELINVVDGKSASCPVAFRPFHGVTVKFWVSADPVNITTYKYYADALKVNGGSFPSFNWRKPALATLKGLSSDTLYTTRAAAVYDENMRNIGQLPARTILGARRLSVRTPGGINYHQFKDSAGNSRWVNSYATNQPE